MRPLAVDGTIETAGPGGGFRLSAAGRRIQLTFASWTALRAAFRSKPMGSRRSRRDAAARAGKALHAAGLELRIWVAGRPWFELTEGGGLLARILGISPFRVILRRPRRSAIDG